MAERIDRINRAVGRTVMWLLLAIVLIQALVVLLRSVFAVGFVPLQESIWYLNGLVFMLGAAYVLGRDRHVRVDIFYRAADDRVKALIDLGGCVLLLAPFCVLTFWLSLPYAATSWSVLERSREVAGLPGIFVLKTAIPVFSALLALQTTSVALKAWARLRQ
ncbi:MAG: TRAP transporter small permease subunit [Pseudomonadota bacterium]